MKSFPQTCIWHICRWLAWPLVCFLYRLRVLNRQILPKKGGLLVVSNHVSYADAIILGSALRRRTRFVILREYYQMPLLRFIVRALGAIPIAGTDSPDSLRRTIESVVAALKEGSCVVIFAEGAMSRTGHLQGFKRGVELIARRAGASILPAYIDGLWGSIFSYAGGRYFSKMPEGLVRPVSVVFGSPLPPETPLWKLRQAVLECGVQAYKARKQNQLPLQVQFWKMARRKWRRQALVDASGTELTWGRALAGSLMLSRWMRRRHPNEPMMGMLLPAGSGAALINAATLMAGRVPVNLNFTASRQSLESAIARCNLRTVFTSRAFIGRIGMPERPEFVYLEEILQQVPARERVMSMLLALLVPSRLAASTLIHGGRMDDIATIMFTSGSTGQPKGVILSQHNIVSNIQQFSEVLSFGAKDTMMAVLPPFHSFGFTATLWTPLTIGMRVLFNPNPLDAKGIGKMVERYGATVMPGTSSFFAIYLRGTPPEHFRTLRLVIGGGQKLVPSVAQAFFEKFGRPVSEGYGCTELSPVAAVSAPDVHYKNNLQFGSRAGSVGRPLPGMSVKVVDRETFEELPTDSEGLILISGPNVMLGYLDDPAATEAVFRDGWYITADIGKVDEDGFIYIHDRVSRFSKIGGEMVPHGAVEQALFEVGERDNNYAVVTLPDRLRGERLVVVYSGPAVAPGEILEKLKVKGLPNLWLPAPGDFLHVEHLPLLASGKPDLVAVRSLAESSL